MSIFIILWLITLIDCDSHSYGLSYNDSGLFSDSSVGFDFIENYFRQDNDSYENEYLQELGIDTNDNNNNDVELVQRKQKRIYKPKRMTIFFLSLKKILYFVNLVVMLLVVSYI